MVWTEELVQVTVWLAGLAVAAVALGHATAPDGQLPVAEVSIFVVCQLAAVPETVYPVGQVIKYVLTSEDVVAGTIQAMPVVGVEVSILSVRIIIFSTPLAWVRELIEKKVNKVKSKTSDIIRTLLYFLPVN